MVGGGPLSLRPGLKAPAQAVVQVGLSHHARPGLSSRPKPRPVAMAADRVQPVPWVSGSVHTGRGQSQGELAVGSLTSQSVSLGASGSLPGSGPPLMSTALWSHLQDAPRAASSASSGVAMGYARQQFRLGPVGGDQGRQGQDFPDESGHGVLPEQSVAAFAHAHRVHHQGEKRSRAEPGPEPSMTGAEKSMPVLAATTGKPSSTVASCRAANSGSGAWMPVTPRPFWAVRAVMTQLP